MNKTISEEYVFLDLEFASKEDVFKFISQKAEELKITSDANKLVQGFINRENESSTGFEDGFAIPHARIKEIKKAAVFVVRFKNGVEWNSLDGKQTKVAVALLIPDGPSGDEHLSILSDIAVKLMDEKFKKLLKSEKNISKIINLFSQEKENKKESVKKQDGLNILAITACTVGVAHTYMAEEKLLKEVSKMGHNIKVETHGSKGIGTPFSQKDIAEADLVVFAVDVNVDKQRFAGKKFYQVKVSKAIKDPQGVINEAISKGSVLNSDIKFETKNVQKNAGPLQHVMAGISYMIPIIILGGICLAFSLGIAKAMWGPSANTTGKDGASKWNILNVLNIIGGASFALMIPILGGFIANSVAGRSAIAPAMVAAFIGNQAGSYGDDGSVASLGDLMPWVKGMDVVQTPLGFIGAIIAGLCVGYFVRWVNTWRVPRSLQAAMPIFFVPIVAGIGMSLIFIYVIGAPIGFVMQKVQDGIKSAYAGKIGIGVGIGLGVVLGAMGGFDMGGPVNKIAFITCSMLVTQGIYEPMGSLAAGIPVAPISMGITTFIAPKFFTKDEKGLGIAALIMGCIGISEGAIPFAIRDPKRAVVSNVLGSAAAAGVAGAFGCQDYAAHGGPIVAILGAVPYGTQTLYFFISILVGVAVTTSIYASWLRFDAGAIGSVKEEHVTYLMKLSSDKKDAISDIKDEIVSLKSERKTNKDANTNFITSKINSLKDEIKNCVRTYKENVVKAKSAYKEAFKKEKNFIKQNKKEILSKIKSVNIESKKQISSLVKNEKYSENKSILKDERKQKSDNISIQYREEFVKEYVSLR